MYFPNLFESSKEKEAYDRLKQRTILILNSIIEGKDNAKDIEKIDNDMLSISKPKQFQRVVKVQKYYLINSLKKHVY